MLTAKIVTTDREIDLISALSKANLKSTLSAEEKDKEGFVTWVYTPEILKAIHAVIPSVVVKDGDFVAAYCLSLSPASNPRSLKAHEKVGFRRIATHRDEMDQWDVVLWDWKK